MAGTELDILILGSGGAAAEAIKALRGAGFQGRVGLAAETEGAVFNPMLGPYFLKGLVSFEDCFLHREGFFRRYGVEVFPDSPARRLDADQRTVELDGGRLLHYRRCLVATGARPKVPPVPGIRQSDLCLTWRNAASTLALDRALIRGREAAIIGGSLVGLKAAEICRRRGIKPTVIELEDQILPGAAHPRLARQLEDHFVAQGVTIITGGSVQGFEQGSRQVALTLEDGRIITTDLCLLAAGVEPSLEFIDPNQVRVDQGLVVDREQRTSAPDLFAAGDACQSRDLLTGQSKWLGLWANACLQGRTAGLNLAGQKASFPGAVAQLVSPFFDLVFAQVGEVVPDGQEVQTWTLTEPGPGSQKMGLLQFREGRLIGFNLLGALDEAFLLKELLIKEVDLSPVLSPDGEPTWPEAIRRLKAVWAANHARGRLPERGSESSLS